MGAGKEGGSSKLGEISFVFGIQMLAEKSMEKLPPHSPPPPKKKEEEKAGISSRESSEASGCMVRESCLTLFQRALTAHAFNFSFGQYLGGTGLWHNSSTPFAPKCLAWEKRMDETDTLTVLVYWVFISVPRNNQTPWGLGGGGLYLCKSTDLRGSLFIFETFACFFFFFAFFSFFSSCVNSSFLLSRYKMKFDSYFFLPKPLFSHLQICLINGHIKKHIFFLGKLCSLLI